MKERKHIAVLAFICIVYICSIWAYKPYQSSCPQVATDSYGYYLYLPSFIIYHDITSLNTTLTARYFYSYPASTMSIVGSTHIDEARPSPLGFPVIKYTMGVALMEFPFFMAAHLSAKAMGISADGFSPIYMIAIQVGVLFYVLLGLCVLYHLLRFYFDETISCLVLLLVALGTNLYFLVTVNGPISHPFLFFSYSLLLFSTIQYYRGYKLRYVLLIGLSLGLIILIRTNEIYAVLIPLLWGINNVQTLKARALLLFKKTSHVILVLGLIILCFIPQLWYWKKTSGHYLYSTHTGFDFSQPLHLLDNICIELAPLLCIPFGAFIQHRWQKNGQKKLIVLFILLICLVNIYRVYHFINS